jgi:hypothetical protein
MSLNLNLEGAQENTPIPDGSYNVIVNKSEVSPTKSGGTMIKVQMKITDGQPQAGRVVFDQFNIENANPQAVQIGLGQLKGLLKSFGHPNPNMLKSTDEMLGLKGTVAVKTIDDGGAYGPQTRVRAYKPLAAATTATAGAAPAAKASNPFA